MDKRIIVDLSFPDGSGVNTNIDITSVYGRDLTYTLPNVHDLTTILQTVGSGAYMWTADLSRAYRQLRIDPLDCPLLAIKVENEFYIVLCPSFGCRLSSAACQCVSKALVYNALVGLAGCKILANLDDYVSCHTDVKKATSQYEEFLQLAQRLGLKLAAEKCQPPSTKIQWLGFAIDSEEMSVSIPKAKLDDVLAQCKTWKAGMRISKKNPIPGG